MESRELDVAIIDYRMCNLFSVQSACNYNSLYSEITHDKDRILAADAAILPGVGSFSEAMEYLNSSGLIQVINEFIKSGKPFMGICLGMQLLLSEGEEFGINKGLDIIPGYVKKFPQRNKNEKIIKVPHIGWNKIEIAEGKSDNDWYIPPLNEINSGEFMYFLHSFYAIPNDKEVVVTTTNYEDVDFCSSLMYNNVFACQFHPERSGREGLKIIKNFADTIKHNKGDVN
jgi:glutamine amidotransferase